VTYEQGLEEANKLYEELEESLGVYDASRIFKQVANVAEFLKGE
jgi:hypothetical protein